jgi:tetratricopeptide (TPR) repeat protein
VRLVGLLLAFGLGLSLLYRLLGMLFRREELVFEDFTNASGLDGLNPLLDGLSFRARQMILRDFERERQIIKDHARRWLGVNLRSDTVEDEIAEAFDQQIHEIIGSVSAIAPDSVKPVLAFARLLAPQRGTRISSMLIVQGKMPPKPVLALEVADLRRRYPPMLQYIEYEPPAMADSAPPNPPAAGGESSGALADPLAQAEGLFVAGQALLHAGLLEDASTYLRSALRYDPDNAIIHQRLADVLALRQKVSAARAAYQQGGELHEAGFLERAIPYWMQPLPEEAREMAAELWRVVHSPEAQPFEKAAAYFHLAGQYNGLPLAAESRELYRQAAAAGSQAAQASMDQMDQFEANMLAQAGMALIRLSQFPAAKKYIDQAVKKDPDGAVVKDALAQLLHLAPPLVLDPSSANFSLAAFYQSTGDLENAQTFGKDALKDQPLDESARALYAEIFAAQNDLPERFLSLVQLGARWLTLELICRRMLFAIPFHFRLTHIARWLANPIVFGRGAAGRMQTGRQVGAGVRPAGCPFTSRPGRSTPGACITLSAFFTRYR